MSIYRDPISDALGIRPIQAFYPNYDIDCDVPDDAILTWGGSISGFTQHEEWVKNRISAIDYKQVSSKLKGRTSPTKGMKRGTPSEETKRKISEANKGKKKDNSKGLMGQYWVGKEKHTFCCIGCQQPVSPSRIGRHGKCFKEYTSR